MSTGINTSDIECSFTSELKCVLTFPGFGTFGATTTQTAGFKGREIRLVFLSFFSVCFGYYHGGVKDQMNEGLMTISSENKNRQMP